METFDFDMTIVLFPESLSPGNEQREYWGSQAADQPGSRNLLGIKSKVIDALIERAGPGARPAEPRRPCPRARPGAAIRLLRDPATFICRRFASPIGTSSAAPRSRPNMRSDFDTWWVDPTAAKSVEAKKGAVVKQ